jgi:SAM-dependent methyltransferase
MNWRGTRNASRERYLLKYDAAEVERYDSLRGLGSLEAADEAAYLDDIRRVCKLDSGMRVLDAGAGTGVLSLLLQQLAALELTALEPSPAMLAKLRGKSRLRDVHCVAGFCDSEADREHFAAASFDVVASRQLVNGLFDPLAAFRNWHHWLACGGRVLVIDGLYGRAGWSGAWAEEVDVLPVSACETMALTPYLLETVGFEVEVVRRMSATNRLACTRTPRYVVVARKQG